ncbi:MAG TPA: molybdopterin dinucleotide binding domain-containing protein, partial [Thermoleophilaceae bacterium]|nr:molybdopterin dinucleotide binding domain-containing protein [Thermoleophilaceae bacterium]
GRETRHALALRFLEPRQQAELSAEDARRLGIRPGDEVEVAMNGTSVRAVARLRQAVQPGTVFLLEGSDLDAGAVVEVRKA